MDQAHLALKYGYVRITCWTVAPVGPRGAADGPFRWASERMCTNQQERRRDETPDARIALVYRGPAGCAGCSETLAERLSQSPLDMDVAFIGPHEEFPLKSSALSGVALYAQPGGGDDIRAAAQSFLRISSAG